MYAPYEPRSRPCFRGDDWHELRDAQYVDRSDDLAGMAGTVHDMYQRACVVVGREDDAVAQSLRAGPFFDPQSLAPAHAHLAAVWRLRNGHVHPSLPGVVDMYPLVRDWQRWLSSEVILWIIDRPLLVRQAAIVVTRSLIQRTSTIVAEMDLLDTLRDRYPLPPTEQMDLFEP